MNTNNPWSSKPGGSQKSGFGYQPNLSGQGSFGQPNAPKPPVYGPASSFGQPHAPKPPVFGAPQPLRPRSQPWDKQPAARPAFGVGPQPAKRNFWGDMNGDGKQDDWDDLLGDGLLMDAMAAQARARRGDPPEPDDEFLIGRRDSVRPSARSSVSTGAGVVVAVGALCVLGLVLFACALSLIGSAY